MNAVFSVARLTRKAKKMALAWGLVALATPSVLQPYAASAQGQIVPPGPNAGPDAGFDFINEQPTRRYASPNETVQWNEEDQGAAGFGVEARIGHQAGDTIGRNKSITNTELMPYIISGDHMTFSSFRLFRSTNAELGGSAGLGYRFFAEDWNKVLGASAWYDLDDHRAVKFEQAGLSLEILGDSWDARANWYVPTGTLTQILGTSVVAGSQEFVGNELRFDERTDVAAAADGFDVMITAPIPGDWAEQHDLEASAGFYNFYSRDLDTDSIWGARVRADGGFFEDLVHMYVEYNTDKQTDHAILFGVSLDWHGGINTVRRRGGSQKNRLAEFVRRNDHVVTLDQPVIETDVTAINPDTGLAYNIVHVDRARDELAVYDPLGTLLPLGGAPDDGVGDGTFENPFLSIEDAFASDPALDIVYVGGGPLNVFTDADFLSPLEIGDGQQLLGEATGVDHFIDVAGITDPVLLPSPTVALTPATSPPVTRPVLQGLLGTAVTLGNGSEFSGFVVDGLDSVDPTIFNTTNGVSGTGITDGAMHDVTITNVSNNGIELIDTTGSFVFESVQVGNLTGGTISTVGPDGIPGTADDGPFSEGALGAGLFVSQGNPIVNFLGVASPLAPDGNHIANTQGFAVHIENTTGGNIGLANVAVVDNGGDGFLILETAGNVAVGPTLLANTTGSAFQVLDSSGTTDLLNTITITNAGDDAFVVNDLSVSGQVNGGIGSIIDITQDGAIADAVGLQLNRIAGSVTLGGSTIVNSTGAIGALTQPAINFQNSSGNVSLATLTVSGRAGAGINMGDENPLLEGGFDPTGALSANSPNEDLDVDETNTGAASFVISGLAQFDQVGSPDLGPGIPFTRGQANIQVLNDFGRFESRENIEITERGGVGIRIEGLEPDARASFGGVNIDDENSVDEGAAIRIVDNAAPVSFNLVEIDGTDDADYVVEIDRNNRVNETDSLSTATVTFRELNLTNIDMGGGRGDAVFNPLNGAIVPDSAIVATSNDRVIIRNGVIDIEDGRAISAILNLNTIDDAGFGTDFMRFESITVDGGTDFGVFLDTNRGDFIVTGVDDAGGSGGTIEGVATGYGIFDHDGDIFLTAVQIENISIGIDIDNQLADEPFDTRTTNIPASTILLSDDDFDNFENVKTNAFIDTAEIVDGAGAFEVAIRMNNVDTIEIENTLIEDFFLNGIILTIDEVNPDDLVYNWSITNSSISDILDLDAVVGATGVQSIMIDVISQASSDDETTLNFLLDSNILDGNNESTTALNMDWDGGVNALINNNVIQDIGQPGDDAALATLEFEVGDDENTSDIVITSNTIDNSDEEGQGIALEADGQIDLTVDNNIFQFNEFEAVGIELDLNAADSDISITANIFNFLDDEGTVVFVDGIVGPAQFEFADNQVNFNPLGINILNPNTVLEFQGVTGTVTLDGDNNTATPVNPFTLLLNPLNSGLFNGSVEINGQFLQ